MTTYNPAIDITGLWPRVFAPEVRVMLRTVETNDDMLMNVYFGGLLIGTVVATARRTTGSALMADGEWRTEEFASTLEAVSFIEDTTDVEA